jgi:hypothetical protein
MIPFSNSLSLLPPFLKLVWRKIKFLINDTINTFQMFILSYLKEVSRLYHRCVKLYQFCTIKVVEDIYI